MAEIGSCSFLGLGKRAGICLRPEPVVAESGGGFDPCKLCQNGMISGLTGLPMSLS